MQNTRRYPPQSVDMGTQAARPRRHFQERPKFHQPAPSEDYLSIPHGSKYVNGILYTNEEINNQKYAYRDLVNSVTNVMRCRERPYDAQILNRRCEEAYKAAGSPEKFSVVMLNQMTQACV